MISVVLYGRNDTHGYNPHRRVALSLNCLAEVLTDAGDEIVFVDYNTPDLLPTLPEALADTLTSRCRSLLRVLRVRPGVHEARFASRTHLPIIEPVARNAAARRANPENRWLLSTTTDMIVVPRDERSLSEVCATLDDGFYGIPRFELPEWVWESFPRSDPGFVLTTLGTLGPGLRLDEPAVSHDWIRFDGPGDFQLVLHDDFFAIDGFDEEMLLGWHVDSNLSKRLLLRRGTIETLGEHVSGYHCNHHRTLTVYHATQDANDLYRFVADLETVDVPAQRSTWGLVEEKLEEIRLDGGTERAFTKAVTALTNTGPPPPRPFDSRTTKHALEYDSRHVLPFVADAIRGARPDATVGYLGTNPVLQELLAALLVSLGGNPLITADVEDESSPAELDRRSDLVVVDLGVESLSLTTPLAEQHGPDAARVRGGLVRSFDAFRRLVELERDRLRRGAHARAFVLVNSAAAFWNAYVLANLDVSSTTPHSRTRHGVVKASPRSGDDVAGMQRRAERLIRWMTRRDFGARALAVTIGREMEVADLDEYSGFGDGWAFPDRAAVRAVGPRADLRLAVGPDWGGPCSLTLSFDEILVAEGETVDVTLLANEVQVATCELPPPGPAEATPGLQDSTHPTIRTPMAWLHAWARDRGITKVAPLRAAYHRALGVRTSALELAGRKTESFPEPRFRWHVQLPSDAVRNGTIDLALLVGPATWSVVRRPGLPLRSLLVDR